MQKSKNSYIKSEIYRGVYLYRIGGKYNYWFARGTVKGKSFAITCKSERDAGLKYDMKMIEMGKEPVNILKRVK